MNIKTVNNQSIDNTNIPKKDEKISIPSTIIKSTILKPETDKLSVNRSIMGSLEQKFKPVINFVHHTEEKISDNTHKIIFGAKSGVSSVIGHIEDAFHPLRVWKNENIPIPPDRGGIKLTSYNIYLGGKQIAKIEKELLKTKPDVVCLQEASPESSQRLAKKLGMHVAYYQMERGVDRVYGKAILTSYPIKDVKNIIYDGSLTEKIGNFAKSIKNHKVNGEVLESRSLLSITIQIGKKDVEIVDTHLSLSDPESNAKQISQLTNYINEERAKGKTVIAAGDFNTNMALAGNNKADISGRMDTPTDTVQEFQERYKKEPGNIGDKRVQDSANRLVESTNVAWTSAEKRSVILDGKSISPEEAKRELNSGKVPKDSPRYRALMQVMDGITHLAANKRFDNIFTTKDVKINSVEIDQDTKGSNHQPITVDVSWK